MKNLETVTLCFENCETAKIDAKHIAQMNVMDIARHIEYYTTAKNETVVHDWLTCHSLAFTLKPGANAKYDSFGDVSEQRLFDRIKMFNDIVSVTLNYDDNSEDEIYVFYDGNETNAAQTTATDSNGCLVITITKSEVAK